MKRKLQDDGRLFEVRERQTFEKKSARRCKAKSAAKIREYKRQHLEDTKDF